ncbi:MAG: TolC family protein [Polyangiales bacterium]
MDITLERALAMARQSSPEAAGREARARLASSRLEAASVRPFNPQISGSLGPRFGEAGTRLNGSVQIRQWFELGGQRGDRQDIARAGVESQEARSARRMHLVERDVSLAFFRALYWEQRVELFEESLRVANAVLASARSRHELGDAGGLESSLATIAAARADTEMQSARVSSLRALGELKVLLGVRADVSLRVRGDLRALGVAPVEPRPSDGAERADLRALRAEVRGARAEAELGRASRWPNFALGARYARDEADDVVQGIFSIQLPFFDRGQGEVAIASAREEVAQRQLESATMAASVELDTSQRAARALSRAARQFEATGLPALARAEELATGNYEAGAVPLAELLLIRRELLHARTTYLDQLFEAAAAQAELVAQRGAR